MKTSLPTSRELLGLLAFFVTWRMGLALLAFFAPYFLPYKPSFPYPENLAASGLPQSIYSWANFDGVHYLTIVEKSYVGTGLIQAFFPVYPFLIKGVTWFGVPMIVAGLILSHVCALLFLIMWYTVLKELYNSRVAWLGVLTFFLFPTSFFLVAVYTESLFLCLILLSLWAAHHRVWWLAGLAAAIASGTRIVGIFLVPALIWEVYSRHVSIDPTQVSKRGVSFWKGFWSVPKLEWFSLICVSCGLIGLLAYMTYLNTTFNDPLYFLHVQEEFGGGRQESIVLFPQIMWRYFKIYTTYRPYDLKYLAFIQEGVVAVIGLIGLGIAALKTRTSWVVFGLGAFILPTLTGTFSSLPRYVLVCLPLFVLLALRFEAKPRSALLYLVLSSLLLMVNVVLFMQGYWVA